MSKSMHMGVTAPTGWLNSGIFAFVKRYWLNVSMLYILLSAKQLPFVLITILIVQDMHDTCMSKTT